MEDINNVNYFDPYSTDSDSKSSDEKENFPILNFNSDTYQDVKNEILQLDSDNNKDYDLNDEIEENTFNKLDEGIDEILSDQLVEDNRYTPCVIINNDNDDNKIRRYNRIDIGGSNRPLAQLKSTWKVDQCFKINSGHLHKRLGKGFKETNCDEKHDELTEILETFGNWIQLVAKSNNELQKQQLIWSLLPALDIRAKAASLKENEYKYHRNLLGESLWQLRISLKNNLPILKNPQSLIQYAAVLPKTL
ncbi:34574_t:CDS:2 [Racocetra persica]|uniref:34574_t:CDS:1 n=1 Tax=Racocetra persica TaxID=160502 RepID=A0ACA9MXS2_9GLOM|nr:34574_t:CDS:2 [Racocetra persica]